MGEEGCWEGEVREEVCVVVWLAGGSVKVRGREERTLEVYVHAGGCGGVDVMEVCAVEVPFLRLIE